MEATGLSVCLPGSSFRKRALNCPLCHNALIPDALWLTPHWLCARGHSYSNVRALIAELADATAAERPAQRAI